MSHESGLKPNRLIHEKSPYLLQHAYNPVDWYPWGSEAFEKARQEDKPVFVSIGYSTCHWCHVMEKESYEDTEVAKTLNDSFVCIKVDREERPDLDEAYMKVCQQLTGSGGWPLHIIMTPDKKPFFAATYIPKENRFGQTGIKQLITKIKELWTYRRSEILESATGITELLSQTQQGSKEQQWSEELTASTMGEAYLQFSQNFDDENGGFGNAPKFPSPHNLMFLLRYWKRTSDNRALDMVVKTLKAMRRGGIYDQLGFGFHRYSTDAEWTVPHFEKMLYDQAMLIMAYTEAFQATKDEEFKDTVFETVNYVQRRLTDSAGGFYSAEDADSEGQEGKFYLWTTEQLRQILSEDEADFAAQVFNMKKEGNFQEPMAQGSTGNNLLHLGKGAGNTALSMHISPEDFQKKLHAISAKLFEAREKRVHPGRDDKVLVDWNGLMIAALSKAARAFHKPEYSIIAKKAAEFVLASMRRSDGRLYHRFREGESKIDGFLTDYGFFVWGLVELYEATFETRYLQNAIELANIMLKHFWDTQQGGFYLTADDAEPTLFRNKEVYDGALPSGNSVACLDLLMLTHMTDESSLEQKAAQLMRFFSGVVSQAPSAHAQLLTALDFALGPSCEIVMVGEAEREDTKEMIEALNDGFIPRKVVMLHQSTDRTPAATFLNIPSDLLTTEPGKTVAYVCCNKVCNPPTSSSRKMMELIEIQTKAAKPAVNH